MRRTFIYPYKEYIVLAHTERYIILSRAVDVYLDYLANLDCELPQTQRWAEQVRDDLQELGKYYEEVGYKEDLTKLDKS